VSGPPAGARPRLLLALLIVIWAASWPVIKIGVTAAPPIWYACLRYVIATVCLLVLAAARRGLVWPSPSDWRLVGVSGALQMGAYSALTGFALTRLPPGRASVLAFSTPLWVVPLAAWRLRERVVPRARMGVVVGLAGVLTIAAPALRRDGTDGLLAYAMLLTASAAWAGSIVFVRGHRFDASTLALAPWQTLVAAALLGPLALVVEGGPPRIGPSGIASLAYVGPVATAFAYWAVVEAGRHFPASTMSMALLATPSLGLVISALALGEPVDASLVLGVALVGAGIGLAVATDSRSRRGAPLVRAGGRGGGATGAGTPAHTSSSTAAR
jgi:drug/metabolite transporter (DMT)-like permease